MVEKCLKLGGAGLNEQRDAVVEELMQSPNLGRLLQVGAAFLGGLSTSWSRGGPPAAGPGRAWDRRGRWAGGWVDMAAQQTCTGGKEGETGGGRHEMGAAPPMHDHAASARAAAARISHLLTWPACPCFLLPI